jgi:hypothetical protein
MAKKLKKAILAGLTAYAASKALSGKGDWRKDLKHTYGKKPIIQDALTGDGKGMEGVYKPKHFKPSKVPGEKKKGWFSELWDGSGIGFRSKGGSAKSYSGGGAINTRLNGKVKFRTY